jgi:hypothetical protein
MGYKRFETDQRVIVSVADLLQDRLEILRINQATVLGCSITRAHNYGYCRACSILRSKCKVYVLRRKPASQEIISGRV